MRNLFKTSKSLATQPSLDRERTLEFELIQQREEVERSKRSKELFFANMSHEIRTPMNAIVGLSEQLAKSNLDPKQRKLVGNIQNSASHLMLLIKDILDLSRLEAGKETLESVGFNPASILDKVIKMIRPKTEEKGLEFQVSKCSGSLSPVLLGDPYRITQVLLNLLSNAVKFTEKGRVSVSCDLIQDFSDRQEVEIKICDTGIGMDPEFVQTNFERLGQIGTLSARTKRGEGTGLGMTITQQLLDLMGGSLEVKSKRGVGTEVFVRLTLMKGDKSDLPTEKFIQMDLSQLSGLQVLVVDDNEFNRMVASTILEQYDMKVYMAHHGKEAVSACQRQAFDLILMDIQMPIMDGITASKIIKREIDPHVHIVALTAFAMKGDDQKYLDQGMDGFLAKPYQEKDLLHLLSGIFGSTISMDISNEPASRLATSRYSLSELEAISNGDQEFVDKMIQIFKSNAKEGLLELRAAFEVGEFDQVRKIAHRIKPSIKMLKIHEISDEVSELEQKIVQEQQSARMVYIVSHMEEVLKEILIAIEQTKK